MTANSLEGAEHDHTAMNFYFDQRIKTKIKELLELKVNTRNIRKHLIEEGFFSEETAVSDQVFYSKTSNLRKKLNLDRKKIGLREFEDIIEEPICKFEVIKRSTQLFLLICESFAHNLH